MQVEIYVVKTEILNKKAPIENLAKLSAIKAEISQKCEGISVLPEIRGEWWENGTVYEDIVEIWRILASDDKPIDFIWLNRKIDEIKALTLQKSQLMTTNVNCKAYFH